MLKIFAKENERKAKSAHWKGMCIASWKKHALLPDSYQSRERKKETFNAKPNMKQFITTWMSKLIESNIYTRFDTKTLIKNLIYLVKKIVTKYDSSIIVAS